MQRPILLLAAFVLILPSGCRQGGLFSMGKPLSPEDAMAIASLDQYAKKHGLSREEAARRLRREADTAAMTSASQPSQTGRQDGWPTSGASSYPVRPAAAYAVPPGGDFHPDAGPPSPSSLER